MSMEPVCPSCGCRIEVVGYDYCCHQSACALHGLHFSQEAWYAMGAVIKARLQARTPVPPTLLPCPFCGEEEDIRVNEQRHHGRPLEIDGHKFWRVECLPCDARTGNFFDADYPDQPQGGRAAAISAWNSRINKKD